MNTSSAILTFVPLILSRRHLFNVLSLCFLVRLLLFPTLRHGLPCAGYSGSSAAWRVCGRSYPPSACPSCQVNGTLYVGAGDCCIPTSTRKLVCVTIFFLRQFVDGGRRATISPWSHSHWNPDSGRKVFPGSKFLNNCLGPSRGS